MSDSLMKAHPENGDYRFFNALTLGQIGLSDSGLLVLQPLLLHSPVRNDVKELEYSLYFQNQLYTKVDSLAEGIMGLNQPFSHNWQSHVWVHAVAKINLGEY